MAEPKSTTPPHSDHIPRATHGSPDHPLRIAGGEIPCYVLEDGTRVLAMTGMLKSLDMSLGGSGGNPRGAKDRLARFVTTKSLNPFISEGLLSRIYEPIKFRTPHGSLANGYEATILADLCDAVLEARKAGALIQKQTHIAERAEVLVRGFARVGIIALVDEATGYQEKRERDELHRILALYLTDERLGWAKRFPDEYFRQLARLWGWNWSSMGGQSPRYVGHLTNRLVYDRLPPGVLEELKRRNPPSEETRRRKWRHHQFLTEDFGQPELRDHILRLVTVMQLSADRETFERNFAEVFPVPGGQLNLLDDVEYKKAEVA